MKKLTRYSLLSLAAVLFAGSLLNTSPIAANADDDFIVDLHSKTFLKVETGEHFTVVLSTDNEVFTFGRNHLGQLGIGSTEATLEVNDITESFNLGASETIIDIAAGRHSTVALTSLNRIFTWGSNSFGQLGNGTTGVGLSPIDVTTGFNPSNVAVNKIVAGDENVMVWLAGNVVRIAGRNDTGQLGQGNTNIVSTVVAVNFASLLTGETIKDVGIYAKTAYTLTELGKVLTWGDNGQKQVGNNGSTTVNAPVNITSNFGLTGGEKVISMAIGVNHAVAVTSAYKVFFWGTNSNYAIGEGLAVNTVKNTPFNATSAFIYQDGDNTDGLGTHDYGYNTYYKEPLRVFAGNDSTFFEVRAGESTDDEPTPYYYDEYEYYVVGLGVYEGDNYILGEDAVEDWETYVLQLDYVYWDYYDEGYELIDFGFSRTNLILLNSEGDFTMSGSNAYGQQGLGYPSDGGEYENTNYSYNVRDFIDYIYAYLPTNLTLPVDDYFYPAIGGMTPALADEYYAIYGEWANWGRLNPGLLDYFFPEIYQSGYSFNEKEWSLFSDSELTFMRQIIATLFENEVLYESWIKTNELILEELDEEYGTETAYWIRYDMKLYAEYGSYDVADGDEAYLDDETASLVSDTTELRLDFYRETITNVEGFEQNVLQPFLNDVIAEKDALIDSDLWLYYFDDYYDENVLDLGSDEIEFLIQEGYEDDILAIFAAFDELSDMEQLLIDEYHYWGIYDELFNAYYDYFADDYADELYDFMYDVQEEDWYLYYPLFENLEALEALLEKINDLPSLSFDRFTEIYTDFWGDEYYDYETYEYWLHLNELLPLLKEGFPVFEQLKNVDENLLQYDSEYDEYYFDLEDIAAVIKMFNDYTALSEDAQDLLDGEYIYWLYELALETLANYVENLLWDLYNIEDESGTYGLFANYDDVLAALAAFEDLPEEALEYLDEEATSYYEYLLGLKEHLEEGLDVYAQIVEIENFDFDDLSPEDIEAIGDMYQAYLALSPEAQQLLNPEYVDYLMSLTVEFVESNVSNLPETLEDFEATFNDLETKDQTIANLLAAWNAYQAMSEEMKELMDPEQRAHLEALYARYQELIKPNVDLGMIGLIILHLLAGTYFAFKKRDLLVPIVKE